MAADTTTMAAGMAATEETTTITTTTTTQTNLGCIVGPTDGTKHTTARAAPASASDTNHTEQHIPERAAIRRITSK